MSETPTGIPEDQIDRYGALDRLLGWVLGKKSAGGATPPIKNLREMAKLTPPERLDQLIEAAARSERQEYQRQGLIDPDEPTEASPTP